MTLTNRHTTIPTITTTLTDNIVHRYEGKVLCALPSLRST
ncbi:hypothetical protein HMPREF9622_01410 [Cutibacterium modestum HL037PA3]|nr:hypothetical protein HMPREF9621_01024 [Cutibacterium modestum HL037PA2]EFT15635.1 hypothetical protein HMPREF9622_01410 [Cutibacterium modestum HL037PA3]